MITLLICLIIGLFTPETHPGYGCDTPAAELAAAAPELINYCEV